MSGEWLWGPRMTHSDGRWWVRYRQGEPRVPWRWWNPHHLLLRLHHWRWQRRYW